ncbi:MAG TPA: CBS domain-containing protein [Candidatus Limnocylindria bacterium]|nr:CBS domain-containing protein [Candidatus Limnocylindria bacterium]
MNQAIKFGRYNWMRVVDIMTEAPLTVTPMDTIRHAEALMSEHGVRQLPVVRGKELVGVVTDRDVRSVLGHGLSIEPEAGTNALQVPVENIMTREPITLSPNDDLKTAVAALIDDKFGGFPVVDKDAGLLGIVTYIDLMRCFLNRLQED